ILSLGGAQYRPFSGRVHIVTANQFFARARAKPFRDGITGQRGIYTERRATTRQIRNFSSGCPAPQPDLQAPAPRTLPKPAALGTEVLAEGTALNEPCGLVTLARVHRKLCLSRLAAHATRAPQSGARVETNSGRRPLYDSDSSERGGF